MNLNLRSMTAIPLSAAMVFLCACSGSFQLYVDNPAQSTSISMDLMDSIVYATSKASMGGSELTPYEVIYIRDAAARDDGQLSEFEYRVILNALDGAVLGVTDARGAADSLRKYGVKLTWQAPYIERYSQKSHQGPIVVEPGPFGADLTNADPSVLFGRRGAPRPKPRMPGPALFAFVRKLKNHCQPQSHKAPVHLPFMQGRLKFTDNACYRMNTTTSSVGYMFVARFEESPEFTQYVSAVRKAGSGVSDWSKILGSGSKDQYAIHDAEGTTYGFYKLVISEEQTRSVVVIFSTEPVPPYMVKLLEEYLAEAIAEHQRAVAGYHSRLSEAPESDGDTWPPIDTKQVWADPAAAYVAAHEDGRTACQTTMLLMIAAQGGHAEAVEEIIPRLESGDGLQEPAPILAAAWRARKAREAGGIGDPNAGE